MMIKLSDYVMQFLYQQHVRHIFMMIGGAITHLADSAARLGNIDLITMHHEQGAAFAAEGYARGNGKLGVAMATSGPGATNFITGIGSCYFDSVPCLFITGQVNTYEYKFDQPVRQIGFQETDIVSIVKPITKGARLVADPKDIRRDLEWAVWLAQSGRPGPVLLDIPMNFQRAMIDPAELVSFDGEQEGIVLSRQQLNSIINRLEQAERPVVLVGGGVRAANAEAELLEFIQKTNIPVVASLMGLDAFPHTHEAYVGMLGTYGNRYANLTVANADCLLILGSRLDSRQTGTKPETFARQAKIIRVDIDVSEFNRKIKISDEYQIDIKRFLSEMNQHLQQKENNSVVSSEWLEWIRASKKQFAAFSANDKLLENPNKLIYYISKNAASDAVITTDVGQNQMWAAQSFHLTPSQRFFTSGGMGAMGFALPTAIGASFLDKNKQVIAMMGDGGAQINIQELQTIVRHQLPIKIIILNNHSMGMVRQFQEAYFEGRKTGTVEGYDAPSFIGIANAYRIPAFEISEEKKAALTIETFLKSSGPALLEIHLPQTSVLQPKLMVNKPIEEQAPELPRDQLAQIMRIPLWNENI